MVEDFVRATGYLSLGSRFRRIGERLQGDVNMLLDAEGIAVPAPFFPALTAIQRAGSLTVGGLAEAMGVAQPGVTRSLAQMEAMGLVKSARGKKDQRQRTISLTRKGDELVTRTHQDLWPGCARRSLTCAPASTDRSRSMPCTWNSSAASGLVMLSVRSAPARTRTMRSGPLSTPITTSIWAGPSITSSSAGASVGIGASVPSGVLLGLRADKDG